MSVLKELSQLHLIQLEDEGRQITSLIDGVLGGMMLTFKAFMKENSYMLMLIYKAFRDEFPKIWTSRIIQSVAKLRED